MTLDVIIMDLTRAYSGNDHGKRNRAALATPCIVLTRLKRVNVYSQHFITLISYIKAEHLIKT